MEPVEHRRGAKTPETEKPVKKRLAFSVESMLSNHKDSSKSGVNRTAEVTPSETAGTLLLEHSGGDDSDLDEDDNRSSSESRSALHSPGVGMSCKQAPFSVNGLLSPGRKTAGEGEMGVAPPLPYPHPLMTLPGGLEAGSWPAGLGHPWHPALTTHPS